MNTKERAKTIANEVREHQEGYTEALRDLQGYIIDQSAGGNDDADDLMGFLRLTEDMLALVEHIANDRQP